jgi:hypothetical protein
LFDDLVHCDTLWDVRGEGRKEALWFCLDADRDPEARLLVCLEACRRMYDHE